MGRLLGKYPCVVKTAVRYLCYARSSSSTANADARKAASEMSMVEKQLATKIGNAASSIQGVFCCGGSLPTPQGGLSLWFTEREGNRAFQLKFPTTKDNEKVQQLLECCNPATFGKDKENIDDKSDRKALEMDPDFFATNFDLGKTNILADVLATLGSCTCVHLHTAATIPTLAPPSTTDLIQGISAQLYKLNIYQPGGFFKSQADTPRAGNMFGSLVVWLPLDHTGGQLIVRHSGYTQVFDWSGGDGNALHWAAFFSDCEHEILEVKSGHRVTITFNLLRSYKPGTGVELPPMSAHYPMECCCCSDDVSGFPHWRNDFEMVDVLRRHEFRRKYMASARAVNYFPGSTNSHLDPRTLPLYQVLCEARDNANFFPQGCILAFGCQHQYVETEEIPVWDEDDRAVLQGADAMLYAAAHSAGLKPWLVSMFLNGPNEKWDKYDDPPRIMSRKEVIFGESMSVPTPDDIGWFCLKNLVLEACHSREEDDFVVWCTREQAWMLRGESGHSTVYQWAWYTAAAIVLHLPPWNQRSKQSSTPDD